MEFDLMSYFQERTYQGNIKTHTKKLRYWNSVLGKDLVDRLRYKRNFNDYLCYDKFKDKKSISFAKILEQPSKLSVGESNKLKRMAVESPNICFEPFYLPLSEIAITEVRKYLRNINCYQPEVLLDFGEWVCVSLQSVCTRTLIANMHKLKNEGRLKGKDKKEEYAYYCEKVVGTKEGREQLFDEFPVLYRCVSEAVSQKVNYFCEIMQNYNADIMSLYKKRIIKDRTKASIQHIKGGFSDAHRGGRQVLRVMLESGESIIYKPHPMENEQMYLDVLSWLENETKISQKHYQIFSEKTHSWCGIVEKEECKEEAELREYYRRLGVQLFLAYVLGTKDLHSENIIASGAYPVLVDLETLVNLPSGRKGESAEAEIYYQLSHSVLYTGLLPFFSWSKEGKGVNASAISGIEGQVYPFKIPVVINQKTSEMQIVYKYPCTQKSDNLAFLNGEFKEPYLFEKELVEGFEKSYHAVLKKKEEFLRIIDRLSNTESRYLVADTQRYHMQLAASYHPDLLRDGVEREIFLNSMWLGRNWEDKKIEQIVESEIKDLLRGDIPYFSYRLNQTSLFDSEGKSVENYFEEPAIEMIKVKIGNLNDVDLRNQSNLIHVSMQLMPGKDNGFINGVYGREKIEEVGEVTEEEKLEALKKVTDKILEAAVYNKQKTDVSWYGVQFMPYGEQGWDIKPMNMYFYSGIAGMAVVFHKLRSLDRREEIERLVEILDKKLFVYTNNCRENKSKVQSRFTGMYEGEASIVYAYLCIYQIEQCEKYLWYAEMHSEVLEGMLEYDESYDLLSGNAGAARIFISLYEVTKKKKYLDAAKKAVSYLEKAASWQDVGVGWVTEKGIKPMAGMAHGNSGIIIPFVQLWKYTGDEHYIQMAGEILEYENSLYDGEIQNWRDVRGEGVQEEVKDEYGAIAWCHGAAGILSSRVLCLKYVVGAKLENEVRRDIERAFQKVWRYPARDSRSLCHGTCGNMMILEKANPRENQKILKYHLVKSVLGENVKGIAQEEIIYGIMNGWGGIVCSLSIE